MEARRTLDCCIGDASIPLLARLVWLRGLAHAIERAHAAGRAYGGMRARDVVVHDDANVTVRATLGAPSRDAIAKDCRDWAAIAATLVGDRAPPAVSALLRAVASEPDAQAMRRAREALATWDLAGREDTVPIGAAEGPRAGASARRAPRGAIAIVVLAVVAAVVSVAARRRTASAVATTAAVGLVAAEDAGLGQDPRAVAEYAAGLQSLRDDSTEAAARAFDRALAIDPTFAAAHLRRALVGNLFETTSREHFAAASVHRAQLDARERALLDAFEPVMRAVPDLAEAERRLVAARAGGPADADVLLTLAKVRWLRADFTGAIAAVDDVLRAQPRSPLAFERRGYALAMKGDARGALDAYDRCIDLSPAPATCMERAIALLAAEGRCAEVEGMARRAIAVDGDSADAYAALAEALVARDAPEEAVREALRAKWDRTDASSRATTTLADELALTVLRGDGASAERNLAAWEEAVQGSPEEADHVALMLQRGELALERGRPAEAARAATFVLARRAAWTPNTYYPDLSIDADALLRRAGALSYEAYAARRDAWLARDARRPSFFGEIRGPLAWQLAYADAASDGEEARRAVAVLDSLGGIAPAALRDPSADVPIGRTFLLAGDPARARPLFARAAASCAAILEPIVHTRASLLEGTAAERLGDRDGACDAYARVARRWSSLEGSLSAAEARTRARALRCPSR